MSCQRLPVHSRGSSLVTCHYGKCILNGMSYNSYDSVPRDVAQDSSIDDPPSDSHVTNQQDEIYNKTLSEIQHLNHSSAHIGRSYTPVRLLPPSSSTASILEKNYSTSSTPVQSSLSRCFETAKVPDDAVDGGEVTVRAGRVRSSSPVSSNFEMGSNAFTTTLSNNISSDSSSLHDIANISSNAMIGFKLPSDELNTEYHKVNCCEIQMPAVSVDNDDCEIVPTKGYCELQKMPGSMCNGIDGISKCIIVPYFCTDRPNTSQDFHKRLATVASHVSSNVTHFSDDSEDGKVNIDHQLKALDKLTAGETEDDDDDELPLAFVKDRVKAKSTDEYSIREIPNWQKETSISHDKVELARLIAEALAVKVSVLLDRMNEQPYLSQIESARAKRLKHLRKKEEKMAAKKSKKHDDENNDSDGNFGKRVRKQKSENVVKRSKNKAENSDLKCTKHVRESGKSKNRNPKPEKIKSREYVDDSDEDSDGERLTGKCSDEKKHDTSNGEIKQVNYKSNVAPVKRTFDDKKTQSDSDCDDSVVIHQSKNKFNASKRKHKSESKEGVHHEHKSDGTTMKHSKIALHDDVSKSIIISRIIDNDDHSDVDHLPKSNVLKPSCHSDDDLDVDARIIKQKLLKVVKTKSEPVSNEDEVIRNQSYTGDANDAVAMQTSENVHKAGNVRLSESTSTDKSTSQETNSQAIIEDNDSDDEWQKKVETGTSSEEEQRKNDTVKIHAKPGDAVALKHKKHTGSPDGVVHEHKSRIISRPERANKSRPSNKDDNDSVDSAGSRLSSVSKGKSNSSVDGSTEILNECSDERVNNLAISDAAMVHKENAAMKADGMDDIMKYLSCLIDNDKKLKGRAYVNLIGCRAECKSLLRKKRDERRLSETDSMNTDHQSSRHHKSEHKRKQHGHDKEHKKVPETSHSECDVVKIKKSENEIIPVTKVKKNDDHGSEAKKTENGVVKGNKFEESVTKGSKSQDIASEDKLTKKLETRIVGDNLTKKLEKKEQNIVVVCAAADGQGDLFSPDIIIKAKHDKNEELRRKECERLKSAMEQKYTSNSRNVDSATDALNSSRDASTKAADGLITKSVDDVPCINKDSTNMMKTTTPKLVVAKTGWCSADDLPEKEETHADSNVQNRDEKSPDRQSQNELEKADSDVGKAPVAKEVKQSSSRINVKIDSAIAAKWASLSASATQHHNLLTSNARQPVVQLEKMPWRVVDTLLATGHVKSSRREVTRQYIAQLIKQLSRKKSIPNTTASRDSSHDFHKAKSRERDHSKKHDDKDSESVDGERQYESSSKRLKPTNENRNDTCDSMSKAGGNDDVTDTPAVSKPKDAFKSKMEERANAIKRRIEDNRSGTSELKTVQALLAATKTPKPPSRDDRPRHEDSHSQRSFVIPRKRPVEYSVSSEHLKQEEMQRKRTLFNNNMSTADKVGGGRPANFDRDKDRSVFGSVFTKVDQTIGRNQITWEAPKPGGDRGSFRGARGGGPGWGRGGRGGRGGEGFGKWGERNDRNADYIRPGGPATFNDTDLRKSSFNKTEWLPVGHDHDPLGLESSSRPSYSPLQNNDDWNEYSPPRNFSSFAPSVTPSLVPPPGDTSTTDLIDSIRKAAEVFRVAIERGTTMPDNAHTDFTTFMSTFGTTNRADIDCRNIANMTGRGEADETQLSNRIPTIIGLTPTMPPTDRAKRCDFDASSNFAKDCDMRFPMRGNPNGIDHQMPRDIDDRCTRNTMRDIDLRRMDCDYRAIPPVPFTSQDQGSAGQFGLLDGNSDFPIGAGDSSRVLHEQKSVDRELSIDSNNRSLLSTPLSQTSMSASQGNTFHEDPRSGSKGDIGMVSPADTALRVKDKKSTSSFVEELKLEVEKKTEKSGHIQMQEERVAKISEEIELIKVLVSIQSELVDMHCSTNQAAPNDDDDDAISSNQDREEENDQPYSPTISLSRLGTTSEDSRDGSSRRHHISANSVPMDEEGKKLKIIEISKRALKPHFYSGKITTSEFKFIMKKAIDKVTKFDEIIPSRVEKFINAYVEQIVVMRM